MLLIAATSDPPIARPSPGDVPGLFVAGIAVRVVTPDPLLPVSGGVGPSSPVSKQEGDLTVRALVFADDDSKVAIVSVDFLGFPSVLGDKARARKNAFQKVMTENRTFRDPACESTL